MTLEVELSHVITLLIAFFAGCGAFGKVMLHQTEKRMVERFVSQDSARAEGQKAMRDLFEQHLAEERRNASAVQSLERDFLTWKADLPIQYVRREDYVRGQVIIEAKLDTIYNKIEVVQLKGAVNA